MPKKTEDKEKNVGKSKKQPKKKSATNTTKNKTTERTSTPTVTKKNNKKSTTKEISSSKNEATKKRKTTKSSISPRTKKATTKKISKQNEIFEYYDLPYRYNETVVKILAQTPKKLFIYWDISDDDRKNYIDRFGSDFFNNTVPVLIIHNDSINYTFEVEINDFANCWYLDINDAKCKYSIELGRRSKFQSYYIPNNYIHITSSNVIESPNDHILFENQTNTVYFRNVKNNTTYSKDIANLSFIRNIGKIYSIYDAYKKLYSEIYKDEDIINNPSSMNSSSIFK